MRAISTPSTVSGTSVDPVALPPGRPWRAPRGRTGSLAPPDDDLGLVRDLDEQRPHELPVRSGASRGSESWVAYERPVQGGWYPGRYVASSIMGSAGRLSARLRQELLGGLVHPVEVLDHEDEARAPRRLICRRVSKVRVLTASGERSASVSVPTGTPSRWSR